MQFLTGRVRALDVGCGPGVIAIQAAGVLGDGEVTGVDSNPGRVEDASSRARQSNTTNATFQHADALDLPFPDRSFDLTYSTHMLEHVGDQARALAEMRRVTRPTGSVVVSVLESSTPLFYPPCPAMIEIYRGWSRLGEIPGYKNADPGIGPRMWDFARLAGFSSFEVEMFSIPEFTAAANEPDEVHRIFVQASHHARTDHGRYAALMDAGLLAADLSKRAQTELQVWKDHPGAYFARGVGILLVAQP